MKKAYNNEPRSSSSCAACKLLKRRCSPSCIFAPYFRANEPRKFANVHKVFGASNVSKILNEVPEEHREETVNSLLFEAEARLQDPVYGCLGAIALLQTQKFQLEHDLSVARARLAQYKAASSLYTNNYSNNNNIFNYNVNENDLFGLGDHHNKYVNNNHMNICKEEYLISSDQFSQSDGEGHYCATNDFGLVPDLLPL